MVEQSDEALPNGLVLKALAHGAALIALAVAWLRPLHRSAWPAVVIVGFALFAIALPMGVAATSPPEGFHAGVLGGSSQFWSGALGCLFYGTLMGLPLVVVAMLVDRTAHFGFMRVGVLLGMGTALGSLARTMHCPSVHPEHLWAGHATLSLAVGALALLATYFARERAVTP